jgi:cyclase
LGEVFMEQVSPHVYVAADRGACTVGAIKTSEGVVLVDSPNRATGAVKWRQEISGLGPVRYLINTEHHVDHVFGNYFLPGVIIANHYTKENFFQEGFHGKASKPGPSRLLDPEGYMKDEDPAGIDLVADYKPREPEISFHGRLTLRLADITIEVFETPGHMPANSVVYVKEDKVLFTGDNVFNGVMTWFHERSHRRDEPRG